MTQTHDLIVLGGGPAGAVAAWLAARDGLDIVLIDPCTAEDRIEGMSPRLHRWLDGQGLLAGFAGLVGPLSRISHWAAQPTNGNAEWIVHRPALDTHLRQAAVAAGARLIPGTARVEATGPEGVTIHLDGGARLTARQVFDARGRKAHAGIRDMRRAPATLSISGWAAADRAAPRGVRVVPIAQGWLWIAQGWPGRAWVQFVTDAQGDAPPGARFAAAIAAATETASLPALQPEGPLVIRDCAPALPPFTGDLAVLTIGDAAAAGDPLSGHGQFWAVSGALSATAVRRSLAARPGPETEALARRFLADRLTETFLHQARVGREFARQVADHADAPFWVRRRDFPDDLPLHPQDNGFRIDRAVVVADNLLEEREILRTPATPAGIAWFGSIPAAEAWRALQDRVPLPDLVARWGKAAEHLPDFLMQEAAPPY
ncbi:lycopene cyclase family protein [Rhodovulum tesquicola]|uniref:flavin-dependent monooxygenase QhpG n=1 Tax=Rhodovulum tesquicola TaxID=540254 RepID=UPI002097FB8B|nr:lycopene cyclase family protein [Rhodovulum tesquicola]MCO8143671.1 lycopene cyclase family protein [Rhodovulum tesquicola]